jgi:hypothetical protein
MGAPPRMIRSASTCAPDSPRIEAYTGLKTVAIAH